MALSIGVSQGSRISVGKNMVRVKSVARPNLIVLSVDDGPDVVVSDQAKVEILPKVFVFVGVGRSGTGNRLALEASRDIPIHRIPEGK